MEIYYAMKDFGDGSSGVRWFKDKEIVAKLTWHGNDGWSDDYNTIMLPDDTDLTTMGLRFYDDV